MTNSMFSSPVGDSEIVSKSVRRPVQRKSTKRKSANNIKTDEKFSLHFGFGKFCFKLFLVQYQRPNKLIASFEYDKPPIETCVLALLQGSSNHNASIARAMDKWHDFTINRLPEVIAERELALLYEPRNKVSQNLDGLLMASKLSIAQDKYLSCKENRQMFFDIRKGFWAIQAVASTAHGLGGAFDVDDVKQALDEVRRGINVMHKGDPRGSLNPEHKKLAKYIWEWWESVQPILSNKGNWGMTLRVSKESSPGDGTTSAGALAS